MPYPYHYLKKSRISDKIFAAKERKEPRDNDLCSSFFVIFVFFCGNSLFGCGLPRCAFAPLRWISHSDCMEDGGLESWIRLRRGFQETS